MVSGALLLFCSLGPLAAEPVTGELPYDYGAEGPIVAPVPDDFAIERDPARVTPHTLFVALDGETITEGAFQDDATNNETQLTGIGTEWPPYGAEPGSAERQALLDAVRADYAAYDVDVTDERPTTGVYTMIVVGPLGAGGSNLGVASVGCGGWNRAGVGFARHGAGGDVTKAASTISHEAAHTLGIEHTDDTVDLMYPTYQGGTDPAFVDGCVGLTGQVACSQIHMQYCGAGQQDAHAELLALFGDGVPDLDGPSVEIVDPAPSDRFDTGATIEVLVEASDDFGVQQVKLFRDDALVGTDVSAPYDWTIDGLDDGVYELWAVAIDGSGNEAESAPVMIAVGDAVLPGDDGGGSSSGAGTGDFDPTTFGEDAMRNDGGCGCATGSADRRLAIAALLLVIGCRRRRRRS